MKMNSFKLATAAANARIIQSIDGASARSKQREVREVIHKKCGKEVVAREWSDIHYGEWISGTYYHCFECDEHYLEDDDMEEKGKGTHSS